MSSGRDERGRVSGGDPTMLLLDEAAAEERVRRRLLAPAPTDPDALVYDEGYEDDSGASLTGGPPGIRLRVPGHPLGDGVMARSLGGLSNSGLSGGEARTERPGGLPLRDERTSGRLLGGLRERLQQIEQEDFSGSGSGASEGATELYGGNPLLRGLPSGRSAAERALGAALSGAEADGDPHSDTAGPSGRMRGLGELERVGGRSSTPWWAEMPSDNAAVRGDDLAPFGPLAGKGPPSLDAPSSALRAELENRRPVDLEEPLLKVLDDRMPDRAPTGPLPEAGLGGRSRLEGAARAANALPVGEPEAISGGGRRWGLLVAAIGSLGLSAAGLWWVQSGPRRAPAPAVAAAAAPVSEAASDPASGPAAVSAAAVGVAQNDVEEVNVVVDGGPDDGGMDGATGEGAPEAAPASVGGVGPGPSMGASGDAAVDPSLASAKGGAAGFWDRLVDELATRFAGAPPGGAPARAVAVEVVEVPVAAGADSSRRTGLEAPTGTLFVRTKQDAEIFIDGKSVGDAPGLRLTLEPGWYTVKAVPRGEGYTWTARTRIDPDMLREVALDLGQEPPPPLKRRESRRRR